MTQALGIAGCHPGGPQAAEIWSVCGRAAGVQGSLAAGQPADGGRGEQQSVPDLLLLPLLLWELIVFCWSHMSILAEPGSIGVLGLSGHKALPFS